MFTVFIMPTSAFGVVGVDVAVELITAEQDDVATVEEVSVTWIVASNVPVALYVPVTELLVFPAISLPAQRKS